MKLWRFENEPHRLWERRDACEETEWKRKQRPMSYSWRLFWERSVSEQTNDLTYWDGLAEGDYFHRDKLVKSPDPKKAYYVAYPTIVHALRSNNRLGSFLYQIEAEDVEFIPGSISGAEHYRIKKMEYIAIVGDVSERFRIFIRKTSKFIKSCGGRGHDHLLDQNALAWLNAQEADKLTYEGFVSLYTLKGRTLLREEKKKYPDRYWGGIRRNGEWVDRYWSYSGTARRMWTRFVDDIIIHGKTSFWWETFPPLEERIKDPYEEWWEKIESKKNEKKVVAR